MKAKSNKSNALGVKKKAKLFLENIKNANNLLDILMYSQVRISAQITSFDWQNYLSTVFQGCVMLIVQDILPASPPFPPGMGN